VSFRNPRTSGQLRAGLLVWAVLLGTAGPLIVHGQGQAPPAEGGAQAPGRGGRAGGPGGPGRGGPPPTGRAGARFDPTGYWVSLITEDWRHRIFTPPKGDYEGIPLNPAGRASADTWDPARDESAGEQCRAYGAVGVTRLPTRLHITWQDDTTLKIESDAGTQTRLVSFGPPLGQGGDWQGVSVGTWDYPASLFPGRGRGGPPPGGSLKVVTTRMKPGYIRKNGVPYGANAVLTEYFDRFDVPNGDSLLIVKQELVDPDNLNTPYWASPNFKRQNDAAGWNPTPCSAR
jgi:hypothetical protein